MLLDPSKMAWFGQADLSDFPVLQPMPPGRTTPGGASKEKEPGNPGSFSFSGE
jgi:hypothetical protein